MAPLSGMIGVTYDVNAIKKWTLTAHFKAAVRLNVRNLCKFASNAIDNAFFEKNSFSSGADHSKCLLYYCIFF